MRSSLQTLTLIHQPDIEKKNVDKEEKNIDTDQISNFKEENLISTSNQQNYKSKSNTSTDRRRFQILKLKKAIHLWPKQKR